MKIPSLFFLFLFCFSTLYSFSQSKELDVIIRNFSVSEKYLTLDLSLNPKKKIELRYIDGQDLFTLNCQDYSFSTCYMIIEKYDSSSANYNRIDCAADIDYFPPLDYKGESFKVLDRHPLTKQVQMRLNFLAKGNYRFSFAQYYYYLFRSIKRTAISKPIYVNVLKNPYEA